MRAGHSWMGLVAALLFCCGWAQGHYAVTEYILPCELSKWEPSACGAARPEVPAEMPTLSPPLGEVVRLLVEEYKQASPEERSSYARRLPKTLLYMGPDTALLAFAMLCDVDKEARSAAVEAVCDALCAPLIKTPEAAACVEAALPACLDALKNGPEGVRMTLGFALCMTGLPSEQLRPALLEALNDPSVRVQACVAKGLDWSIKKSPRPLVDPGDIALSPELITYFCDIIRSARGIDEGVYGMAFPVLPAQQDQKRAFLSELLASPDPYVREYAFPHLHAAGRDGMGLFPQASEVLRRRSGIGPAPADTAARSPEEEYVLTVIGMLDSRFSYFRQAALGYLAGLGDRARPAAPRLLKALHARDWQVRHGAFHLLETPPFEGVLTVDTLRGLFQEKDDDQLLVLSIRRLGKMGEAAAEAAPELFSAAGHAEKDVRRAVLEALPNVLPHDDRVTTVLLDAYLGGENDYPGNHLREQLVSRGRTDESAAALIAARYRELLRASGDARQPSVGRLPGVLAAIGGDCLRVAAEGLDTGDAQVRRETVSVLAERGEEAKFSLGKILALAKSDELEVRMAALTALPALAPSDKRVRRMVMASLTDKDIAVARAGISASLRTRFSTRESRRAGSLLLELLEARGAAFRAVPGAEKDAPTSSDFVLALAKYGKHHPEELLDLLFHQNESVAVQAVEAVLVAGISVKGIKDGLLETIGREERPDLLWFALRTDIPKEEIFAHLKDTAVVSRLQELSMVRALSISGGQTAGAIPQLIAKMQPEASFNLGQAGARVDPRMVAFRTLSEIGYNNDQAVAAMAEFARNACGPRRDLHAGFLALLQNRLGLRMSVDLS